MPRLSRATASMRAWRGCNSNLARPHSARRMRPASAGFAFAVDDYCHYGRGGHRAEATEHNPKTRDNGAEAFEGAATRRYSGGAK